MFLVEWGNVWINHGPINLLNKFYIFSMHHHGIQYNDGGFHDNYPNGCPEGLNLEQLMKEFKDKNI